jgi:hypothetical protein
LRAEESPDTDVIAMADFQTHITTSTVLGIAGGLAAHAFYEVPLPSCILAGGLCSVAGMLPDLDSDSGVPLRESVAFAAAIIPMMLLERFAKWGFGFEATILVSAILYLVVRFGVAEALKNYTVHRGMFHSIPAALISAELTFLIFDNENVALRFLNAGAVFTGFMSHLILDELWSVDVNWGLVRFKSSFGSALKFWGDNAWANFATYGKLVVLTLLMTRDPAWNNVVEPWMTGRPIANQDKAWSQQLANWRQLYFQRQYGAIPPNAIDHPWNPLHPQAYSNGNGTQFMQQYPNHYPPTAFDPARPLTSGSTLPLPSQNYNGQPHFMQQSFTQPSFTGQNFTGQNYTGQNLTGQPYQMQPLNYQQPQAYNPALPFTNPQQLNVARLPENYSSHAPSIQQYQSPLYQNPTTSPYQSNPLSPTRPSLNPNNWQLPNSPPTTNSLQYQSQYQTPASSNTAWSATNWNNPTNFTQLGSGLTPNYQNGMTSVSNNYGGYDSTPGYNNANHSPWNQTQKSTLHSYMNQSPWNETPTSRYDTPQYNSVQSYPVPYNSGTQNQSNALDRFPSLQR